MPGAASSDLVLLYLEASRKTAAMPDMPAILKTFVGIWELWLAVPYWTGDLTSTGGPLQTAKAYSQRAQRRL